MKVHTPRGKPRQLVAGRGEPRQRSGLQKVQQMEQHDNEKTGPFTQMSASLAGPSASELSAGNDATKLLDCGVEPQALSSNDRSSALLRTNNVPFEGELEEDSDAINCSSKQLVQVGHCLQPVEDKYNERRCWSFLAMLTRDNVI